MEYQAHSDNVGNQQPREPNSFKDQPTEIREASEEVKEKPGKNENTLAKSSHCLQPFRLDDSKATPIG